MYTQNKAASPETPVQTSPASQANSGPTPIETENCVQYTFYGIWTGNTHQDWGWNSINIFQNNTFVWGPAFGNDSQNQYAYSGDIYSWSASNLRASNPWLLADTTYTWETRAAGQLETYSSGFRSVPWTLKTIAKPVAVASSQLTEHKNSVDISVNWLPNTAESHATISLQYKTAAAQVWQSWIPAIVPPWSTGYEQTTYSEEVTGLTSGTRYQFQVIIFRDTSGIYGPNGGVVAEEPVVVNIGGVSTLPFEPTATTLAATGVTDSYAVFNATVDPDTIQCSVSFQFGASSEPPYTYETQPTIERLSGNRTVSSSTTNIVSLTPSTQYYYRVKVTYNLGGGTVTTYGSEVSFTTNPDQGALARAEDLMQTLQFDGQYATAKTVTFTLKTKATDGSDQYYVSTAPTAAQVKVYRDGTLKAIADNAPTQPNGASTPIYKLVLTTAEMTGEVIDLVVSSAGATFRDEHIQIRTAQRLSEIDVDATNGPTNATAMTCIGNGTGDGIKAVGGATGMDINAILETNWLRVGAARTMATPENNRIRLDAASSSTDDYYNGVIVAILSGAGSGQSRIAVDYIGGADADADGNREIVVDTNWSGGNVPDSTSIYALAPGPRTWEMRSPGELDALPTEESSYGEFLRLLFQRFAFKIDQNADYQTWYKADNSTTFVSRAVEDDGNTQRLYRLAE